MGLGKKAPCIIPFTPAAVSCRFKGHWSFSNWAEATEIKRVFFILSHSCWGRLVHNPVLAHDVLGFPREPLCLWGAKRSLLSSLPANSLCESSRMSTGHTHPAVGPSPPTGVWDQGTELPPKYQIFYHSCSQSYEALSRNEFPSHQGLQFCYYSCFWSKNVCFNQYGYSFLSAVVWSQ